jgi:L-seryl-tRNA(Ser) seleniumtransferase
MLAATTAELDGRATRLAESLGPRARACETTAYAGGGTAPLATVASRGVAVRDDRGADALAARLRNGQPRVVARIEDGDVVIDLRTISPARDHELQDALARALA